MYNILVEWICEIKPSCVLLKIKSVYKEDNVEVEGWNNSFSD